MIDDMKAAPAAEPAEDEMSRRYRMMMAQALMNSGPRQGTQAAPATAGGGWMSALASVMSGAAQGMGRGYGNGTGPEFSLNKTFNNGFAPMDGGMKAGPY